MDNSRIAQHIGQQLAWLKTWKQPKGYGSPVVHYWKDSLCYTGPGLDWKYEGIIISYLLLHKKTGQNSFLDLAVEAGDHLVKGQLSHGQYLHSGFDGNPSGTVGSMPHDTAASVGLMRLALVLRSRNDVRWEKYYHTAKKNLAFHRDYLYDSKTKLFLQTYPSLDHRRHLVPNKHATLAELLLLFYEINKDKTYLQLAERCAEFIISQQDHDRFAGGIHQTDKNHSYIAIYIARCVSGLMAVYKVTKDSRYLDSALQAVEFLQTLAKPKGGFYFGWRKLEEDWYLYKYPQFIAGAGDIVRALFLVRKHKKYLLDKHLDWIDKHTHSHGGVWTSWGMHLKNQKTAETIKEPSWRDVVPVVGWNDKTLRLRAELLKDGTTVKQHSFVSSRKEGFNGRYEEDSDKFVLTLSQKRKYVFAKQNALARRQWYFWPLFALRVQKHLPPALWEKVRRLGQFKEPLHQPSN